MPPDTTSPASSTATAVSTSVASRPSPELPIAVAPRLRPYVEPGGRLSSRYPRPPRFRWLRTALRLWYLAFVVYVGNVIYNLVALVAQSGIHALFIPSNLASVFLLTQLLALWAHAPGVVLAILIVLGALVLGGRWAHADRVREAEVHELRRRLDEWHRTEAAARETARVEVQTVVREQLVARDSEPPSPPQPQGPPDDLALLPIPAHFVGRATDLAWVLDRLRRDSDSTMAVTALEGLGGIGKSSLAALAARRAREEGCFPDGVAVVLCQGLTSSREVLRRVLTRFDPYRRAPQADDLAGLVEAARLALHGKDALVVLDNVEPGLPVAEVVDTLRAAGVTLLLTARQALARAAVPVAASRRLDLLSAHEALEVFAAAMGRSGVDALSAAEHTAAERIVAALDRHTLAVKLAGAYAADARRDLAALARELEDPKQAIDLPDGETPRAVALAFAESTSALPQDTRQLFAALAAFATVEFGRQAALALGSALGQASPEVGLQLLVLRALVEASVSEALPGDSDRERLRLHPLMRAFAENLFARWPQAERDATMQAVAVHYAAYTEANQGRFAVLAADQGNTTGALEWAHAQGHHAVIADISHGLRRFWADCGHWQEALRYLPWGIAATADQAANDEHMRLQQAQIELSYARILDHSGKLDDAEQALQHSLVLFRDLGNQQGEGSVLLSLADHAQLRGRQDEAVDNLHESLRLLREAHDRAGEAEALALLGYIETFRGKLEAADGYLQLSLAIFREVHDRQSEGVALSYLGDAALRRGRLAAAEDYFSEGLVLAREASDRQSEAIELFQLGRVALQRGRLEDAEDDAQQALVIARDMQSRYVEAAGVHTLGLIAFRREQLEQAEKFARQVLGIGRELQDQVTEGAALSLLGQLELRRGHLESAEDLLRQALVLHREGQDRQREALTLRYQAEVAAAQNDTNRAEALARESLSVATEAENGPGISDALLTLGRLLVERQGNPEEGCSLLLEAARRYAEMGMPQEAEARETASRLGCQSIAAGN